MDNLLVVSSRTSAGLPPTYETHSFHSQEQPGLTLPIRPNLHRRSPPETRSEKQAKEKGMVIQEDLPVQAHNTEPTFHSSSSTIGGSVQFVYYTVFTKTGAIPSKQPVNAQDLFIGRIDMKHITPPQTVRSVICCICEKEGVKNWHIAQLFLSSSSLKPMNGNDRVSPLVKSGVGLDPENALALVLEDGALIYNKIIIGKHSRKRGSHDKKWLNYKPGEVLYTNGVLYRAETYAFRNKRNDAYIAQNAKGQIGYVVVDRVSSPSDVIS